jgi:hypothetical protein
LKETPVKSQRNDAQQMLATMMVDPGFDTDLDLPADADVQQIRAMMVDPDADISPAEFQTAMAYYGEVSADPPRFRRQHRLWVADWTVHLREDEIVVEEAFLCDELWRPGDPTRGPGMLVFKSQRAPDSTERQFRIEYTVAQFDPKAVAAVVSHNWRWKHVGEW